MQGEGSARECLRSTLGIMSALEEASDRSLKPSKARQRESMETSKGQTLNTFQGSQGRGFQGGYERHARGYGRHHAFQIGRRHRQGRHSLPDFQPRGLQRRGPRPSLCTRCPPKGSQTVLMGARFGSIRGNQKKTGSAS